MDNKNNKIDIHSIPPVEKNEHYMSLLSHLDNAIQNWKNFTRLDRLEYAYKCLELARNYTCATRGVDPATVKPSLEIKQDGDWTGKTRTAKYADDKIQSVVVLSVKDMLTALKITPERIMQIALHENTHACDANFMERPYLENVVGNGQVKIGDIRYPEEYYKAISKSYKEFGVAWQGKAEEIRANAVAFGVTANLLQDLAEQHPDSQPYQARYSVYEKQTSSQLEKQYEANEQLEQWKLELQERYAAEGQEVTHFPDNFGIEPHPFVTIEDVEKVAEENPEIFKTEGYALSELNGASNKQEIEAQEPEVLEAFKQNNNFCTDAILGAVTPQTTTEFFPEVQTLDDAQ